MPRPRQSHLYPIEQVAESIDHGSNRDVDTAAEALTTTSFVCQHGVLLKADKNNAGTVYVGLSDVTAGSTAATDGFPLDANDVLFIEIANPNLLYVIASEVNQIIYWIAS